MVSNILPEEKLFQVHPVVKQLFFKGIPKVNLAGRLKFFLQEWEILYTQDPTIIETIKGYNIPFLHTPTQHSPPHQPRMKVQEELLIHEEIETMLMKLAIQEVPHVRKKFLSNLFLG